MVGLGGSWAQRDVFKQLLVHSGLRSGEPTTVLKALGVLEEREALKPNSPVAKRLVEKHKSTHHAGSGIATGGGVVGQVEDLAQRLR